MTGLGGDPVDDPALSALLRSLDGVAFVLDDAGDLRSWNDRLPAVTGYGEPDLAGTPAVELVAPEDGDRVAAAIDAVLETGQTSVDAALLTDAGTTLPYALRARRLADDDGTVTGVVGVGRPVGDRGHLRGRLADDAELLAVHDHCEALDAGFPERVDAAIALGRDRLGMDYGFLTRIEGDVQEVVMAQGTHDRLQPGETCPLSEAYCRKTIHEETMLGVHNAVEAGWSDDRAYDAFELGAYVGAKVSVDGSLFGTLCFASSAPRTDQFSVSERTLVELLAAWTSHELAAEQAEGVFARQHDRVEEFASMVSHDLRNPLSVARGRLETDEAPPDAEAVEAATGALDRMEGLIEDVLALVRGREAVEDTRPVDGEAVARQAWENSDTADAALVVEPFTVEADHSRLLQLFENLFRNAVEHGSTSPQQAEDAVEHGGDGVTVRVGPTEEGFYVADDGAGIPDDVRGQVFERGFSTAASGTGLGLNIVRSIAGAHGWRIEAGASEAGGARFVVSGAAVVIPEV